MKNEKIVVLTSIENTLLKMPKYYPASRCGAHKNKKKYNCKDKSWKKELY